MVAIAIQSQTKMAQIPAEHRDASLADLKLTPTISIEPREFRQWYLDGLLFFITGVHREQLASAILRQTFTYTSTSLYPYRAHYGEAFSEIIDRDNANILNYRHLVLANIDTIDDQRMSAFVTIVRQRTARGRVTIMTSYSDNVLRKMPDDLVVRMMKNKLTA